MKKISKISFVVLILIGFTQCKSQKGKVNVPFEITEQTYFNFVGGKEGVNGTTIKLVGYIKSRNIAFSAIFFQNHEYKIVPEFRGEEFILIGNNANLNKKDIQMSQKASSEYGNTVPSVSKKIPFDLAKNEAILVYAVNGKNFYYKLSNVKQLDTVYYP